jgi:hypothetical protein
MRTVEKHDMEKLGITLPKSMIERIDRKRGDITGAGALEERLKAS